MQQKDEKNLKIFATPCQFGTWLNEKRLAQHISLREMALRCQQSAIVAGTVSAGYINKLEHGIDVIISPEKLLMFKDVLVVSYGELLEHLTERNYVRFSNYLNNKRLTRIVEVGGTEKNEEWFGFLQRADGISRKIIEPLLWDLVSRNLIGCELIPYTWPDDFWAGTSSIEDMGECMASLADIFDSIENTHDHVANATRAVIQDAIGEEYIEGRRERRVKFNKQLKQRNRKKNKGS